MSIDHGSPRLPRARDDARDGALAPRSAGRTLALALGVPAVSAVSVLGLVLGVSMDTGARTPSGDMDMGAAMGVVAGAALLGVTLWVLGTIWLVRALFPAGERAVSWLMLAVVGIVSTAILVPAALYALVPDAVKIVGLLAPQALMSGTLLLQDRVLRRPRPPRPVP
jgi:hypothetical protein